MAASLPQEIGLALVTRLAEDDGFRTHFQNDPRAALRSLDVPESVLDELAAECFESRPLADRQVFAALATDLGSDQFRAAMSMWIPTVAVR